MAAYFVSGVLHLQQFGCCYFVVWVVGGEVSCGYVECSYDVSVSH